MSMQTSTPKGFEVSEVVKGFEVSEVVNLFGVAALPVSPAMRSAPRMPLGMLRICAGIAESADTEPYLTATALAEAHVQRACTDLTESQRAGLAEAVKRNLINRKKFPVDLMCFLYELPVGRRRFALERRRFCWALLTQLGLLGGDYSCSRRVRALEDG